MGGCLGVFHVLPGLAAQSQNITDGPLAMGELGSGETTVHCLFNGSVSGRPSTGPKSMFPAFLSAGFAGLSSLNLRHVCVLGGSWLF